MGIDEFVTKHGSVTFLGSKEVPEWHPYPDAFNSGNFFILNTEKALEIFTKWFALYNPADWKWNDERKTFTTDMPYAQDAYEQGSFQKNILPNYPNDIKLLESDVLNNYRSDCDKNPETFVCQFINTPPNTAQRNGKDNLAPFVISHGLLKS